MARCLAAAQEAGAFRYGRPIPTRNFTSSQEAKRARYTAELIAPIMGRWGHQRPDRFIHLVTQVQDVLGEHQDAIVAGQAIELAARRTRR